jgi:uncharacterized membrane protein YqjE
MSIYMPAIVGAFMVCLALSSAIPSLRRSLMVVTVVLVAALAFAPNIAPGIRVLALVFAAIGAVACAWKLRQPRATR